MDDLARRLAAVCVTDRDVTGPARRAVLDAVDRAGVGLDLVDEMISWLETEADTPTRSPRRLTAMVGAWAPTSPPPVTGGRFGGSDAGFGLFDLAAGADGVPFDSSPFDGSSFDDVVEPDAGWAPPPDGLFDEMRAMLAGQKVDAGAGTGGTSRREKVSRW